MVVIDGKTYIEKSSDDLPFGNACNHCAFRGATPGCYNRLDIDCHFDSRPDGRDVVFILVEG